MVVTDAQARQAVRENGERLTLSDADFTPGRDDNTSIDAGDVGEIATAEIGEDGQLSSYNALIVGAPGAGGTAGTAGNEPYVDLESGTDGTDVADTTEWALAARKKGELGGGAEGNITGYRSMRGADDSDPRKRTPLYPQRPLVKSGRILQLIVKNEQASVTVELANSVLEVPAIGGSL